jgi:hypothetical protein
MSGRLFAQIVGLILIAGFVLFLVNWATRSQAVHEIKTEQNAIEAKYAPAADVPMGNDVLTVDATNAGTANLSGE